MTPASDRLLATLKSFFRSTAPLEPGERVLVALSGGTDSTALLWGLLELRHSLGHEVTAAHLDHGLDRASGDRARHAERLCETLGVPLAVSRCSAPGATEAGSLEARARTARYDFLERQRQAVDARYVATAHQQDDQIETVILRLAFGSGVAGLAGIPATRGNIVRPCLALPRSVLAAVLQEQSLPAIEDPTNRDPAQPRSRVRHQVLPALRRAEPGIEATVLGLARAASAAGAALEARLRDRLQPEPRSGGADCSLAGLVSLPRELWSPALALLHRTAGLHYPPRADARMELARQVSRGSAIGCDCGGGWRWEARGDRLAVTRRATETGRFTYTVPVPGEVSIPEIALHLSVTREPVASWMFRGSRTRAALSLPIEAGGSVLVRNRRPGDQIQPLGCRYRRRLKELFIDHRVPQRERDRVPLLVANGAIAWVPGITIHDSFRLRDDQHAWVASLESLPDKPGS